MKNLAPTLMICGVLVLGILLFKLMFNAVRSEPVASATAGGASPAPGARSSAAAEPQADDSTANNANEDDSTSEDADDEESADDSRPRGFTNPPRRSKKGFTNPPERPASPTRSGFTSIGERQSRGFTNPGERPAAITPQNPFVRHGSRDHWTSFEDAADYVAGEIFDAVEDRPTLVVWLFDRTSSASTMRKRVGRRFESIYQKFDGLKAAGHPSFADSEIPRLVSVVGAFGDSFEFLTPEPTDSSSQLMQAVSSIRDDGSGEEHTFAAIETAVKQLGKYRASQNRLMLLVVVSDEAGDDDAMVDQLVPRLSKAAIPVYVIGVPAPLGLKSSLSGVAQMESKRPIRQGPESLESEAIDMGGWTGAETPVDSGFGPFALSRLALETGGRYMPVRLIATYDIQQMAQHAPDYVSRAAYDQLLSSNQARRALVEAARQPHVDLMAHFDLLFPKPKDEAALKRLLDKAQQNAARLEPKVAPFYKALAAGESDRKKLTGLRWQAEYDLAMGRAAAMRSRIEGYNASLAQLKAGKAFPDPNHTTWILRPTSDVKGDSGLEKLANQARTYLNRVVAEHPGTPWATIATRELSSPLGWEWLSR